MVWVEAVYLSPMFKIMEDALEKVMLKEKESKLSMSRVPKKTKDLFLEIANEDHCGDYGACLKNILDGYMMFKIFFENMDMKLDKILCELNDNTKETEESSESEIKTMDGRIVEKGGMKK